MAGTNEITFTVHTRGLRWVQALLRLAVLLGRIHPALVLLPLPLAAFRMRLVGPGTTGRWQWVHVGSLLRIEHSRAKRRKRSHRHTLTHIGERLSGCLAVVPMAIGVLAILATYAYVVARLWHTVWPEISILAAFIGAMLFLVLLAAITVIRYLRIPQEPDESQEPH